MVKWKLGETFKARVSDNPNALVEPKILGTETLGAGDSQATLQKFERGKAMPESLSRLILSLNFEPIQKSGAAR